MFPIWKDAERCRYVLQLLVCAIYKQLCKAFSNSRSEVIWEALKTKIKNFYNSVGKYIVRFANQDFNIDKSYPLIEIQFMCSAVKIFDEMVLCIRSQQLHLLTFCSIVWLITSRN